MSGQDLLKFLQARFPSVGFTFGYVGNYEGPNRDYRSWMFFTKLPAKSDGFYTNRPSIGVQGSKLSASEVSSVVRRAFELAGEPVPVSLNQLLSLIGS